MTIENVGEASYSGPLIVSDIPDDGGTMTVPPADWTCETLYPGVYECTLDAATLAPGESLSFQASFVVPTWWDQPVFANCVELTTPGSGEDDRTYNNQACGYAPTALPGTPYYAPDLALTKYGLDGQCDWFDNCLFAVRVTNVGAASYTGPVNIHDEIDLAGSALGTWAPAPEWTCGPVGAIGFDCAHPVVTLAPGEFVEVVLWIQAPPIAPGYAHVGNCAWIDWGGAPGDYNPGNEYDCATISRYPPGYPGAIAALDVDKDSLPTCWEGAGPAGGWLCAFRVTVTNDGGAPHLGPIEISDTADIAPSVLADVNPPPWICVPGIGTPGAQICARPGVPGGLQPGESVDLYLDFEAPAGVPVPNAVRNCATVSSDHDGDGIDEDYTELRPYADLPARRTLLSGPRDPQGAAPRSLLPGVPLPVHDCRREHQSHPLSGSARRHRHPRSRRRAAYRHLARGPHVLACRPGLHLHLAARSAAALERGIRDRIRDPAGASRPILHQLRHGPAGAQQQHRHQRRGLRGRLRAVPRPRAVQPVDLPARVELHARCPHRQQGAAALLRQRRPERSLSPAVAITSIESHTPGMVCNVTGSGFYQCQGAGLEIAPGSAARLTMTVDIPADFPSDTITHTKDMVWPDRAVKDKRPENDRHVSTITIEGPKEGPPPPPPPEPPPA